MLFGINCNSESKVGNCLYSRSFMKQHKMKPSTSRSCQRLVLLVLRDQVVHVRLSLRELHLVHACPLSSGLGRYVGAELLPLEKAGRIQVVPFGRRIWLRPAFRLWPTLLGIGTMALAAAALAKALAAGCRGATAVGRRNWGL